MAELYQDLNENKCCQFITTLSGVDENEVFNRNFGNQPLYLTCINANYTKEASIYLAGAICAGFVSVDVEEAERNDREWSNIQLDEDVYSNQKGFSNKEANQIVDNVYVCALQYMSEGIGLIVRGCKDGWSIAMHSCFIQIVNKIPLLIGNLMKISNYKTKSIAVKSKVLLVLQTFGQALLANNFLSNLPKDGDSIMQNLSKQRQLEVKTIGWSAYIKPLNEIKANEIL